MNVRSQAFLIP